MYLRSVVCSSDFAIGILLLLALDFFELAISCLSGSICGLECSFTLSQSLHELRIGRSVRLIECSLVAVERVRLVDELLIAAGFHRLESTREVVFGRAKTTTSCSDCIHCGADSADFEKIGRAPV